MGFKEFKEKRRKIKEERRDPYDKEEIKILMKMKATKPGTEEYKELQQELKSINQIRAESRESKRKISKADKGGILLKILGIGGGAIGLFSIIKAEKDGLVATGEKRTILDAISRAIGNVFVKR